LSNARCSGLATIILRSLCRKLPIDFVGEVAQIPNPVRRNYANHAFLKSHSGKLRQNASQGASPLEIPSRAAIGGIQSFRVALGDLRSQEPGVRRRIRENWELHFLNYFDIQFLFKYLCN
jgi:hypothetical protein